MTRRNPQKLRLRLFDENADMVRLVVGRIGGYWRAKRAGCDLDDLMQAGLVGLWRATALFQRKKGIKFATFARPRVVGEILECLDSARYGKRLRSGNPLIDQSNFRRLPREDNSDDQDD